MTAAATPNCLVHAAPSIFPQMEGASAGRTYRSPPSWDRTRPGSASRQHAEGREAEMHRLFAAVGVAILLSLGVPAFADDTPKRGGILTYMIPADAPPSF